MKLIIDIDEKMYKRICGAQSTPDMYGTDVVNAIKWNSDYKGDMK